MIAEGGTRRGHSVSIARGPSPEGPFEGHRGNPIHTHRSTDHPVQNSGHADLVRTNDGWVMVSLGTRPRGATRAFAPMGRETYQTRVHWQGRLAGGGAVRADRRSADRAGRGRPR